MNIKAVKLWDKTTRLLHWSLALAVVFLSVSGWLMDNIIGDASFWVEWHFMVGQVTVFLVLARAALFFKQGNSHFSRYKISLKDLQVIKDMLKFYLSFARTPLPSWYAINPVWRLLYAAFYLLLILMIMSGLMDSKQLVLGIYWPSVHQSLAFFMSIWLALHVLSVFIHDWKSTVNRISAMISGVAYFESETDADRYPNQQTVIKTNFDKQ